jgi:ferritin-like metal-binding protein YciE
MGMFTQEVQSMDDLFVHGLKDIYYAERQILQALPKMIEKAGNAELKRAFETHLKETENQVERVEQAFQSEDSEAQPGKCPAIDGIISEGEQVMGEVTDPNVLDAAMIAAAQAVEHYEITRYGALVTWAKELGKSKAASLLQRNLAEEKATDKKLTALAERRVNPRAEGRKRPAARRSKKSRSTTGSRASSARGTKKKPQKTKARSASR